MRLNQSLDFYHVQDCISVFASMEELKCDLVA